MENKLKGLDQINWQELNAVNVPNWLQDLTSDDSQIYLNAYRSLDRYVIDIGSDSWDSYGPINEILKTNLQSLIVPFLLQLLDDPQVKRKEDILELLYDLANKVYLSVDKLTGDEWEKAIKIYEAVRTGTPVYRNLSTESFDSLVKQTASHILNFFSLVKKGSN
jgi:hypothetical protein